MDCNHYSSALYSTVSWKVNVIVELEQAHVMHDWLLSYTTVSFSCAHHYLTINL